MYPKVKTLSDEEYMRWKENDPSHSVTHSNIRGALFNVKRNRKGQQRDLNANVKLLNKQIEDDFLWRGRFFVRQVNASWDEFEDKSGGELFVTLRFYDKKDEVYIDSFSTARCLCGGHDSVFILMNKAITEIFDVWPKDKSTLSPYEDRVDYRSIPCEYIVEKAGPMFSDYNYFRA